MGIWDRFFRKESEAYAASVYNFSQGRPITTPRDYRHLAEEGYDKNAIAYACVNRIAGAVKSMRILMYRRTPSGIKEVEDHPFLKLLQYPNPMMAGRKYWENVSGFFQLSGNSYIHAPGLRPDKFPRELWPIFPDTVEITAGPFGMPAKYKIESNGKKKEIQIDPKGERPSEILHIKAFNPTNAWYGHSPIQSAAFSIDQHNEAGLWNVGLLQNSASPSGLLVFKNNLNAEQKKYIDDQFDSKYTGAQNAGRIIKISGSDVDFKGMSFSPKDMEWINSKHTSARDIGVVFGVPSMLLNIQGDNTYANYEEARQAFWVETVLPHVDDLLDYHNLWLYKMTGDDSHFLGYDKDELDALTPSREKLWTRVTNARHLSINEKRVATGYDERPEPEYDEVLVSSSEVPLVYDGSDDESPFSPQDLAQENGSEDPNQEPLDEDVEDEGEMDDDEKSLVEMKFFRLRNAKERRRAWRAQERKRRNHERRFIAQLRAAFEDQAQFVADAVKSSSDSQYALISASAAIHEHTDRTLAKIIKSNMAEVGRDFGRSVLRDAKSCRFIPERKQEDLRFDSFLNSWIEIHSGRRITQVTESTKRKVNRAVQLAFENEEGIPDLAKAIEDVYSGFTRKRATLIARTETVAASNAATLGAAKATGISNLKKEWIPSNDGRSRDGKGSTNHRAMEGVQVDINEKFLVPSDDGRDEMDQPGDPNAPVDQIANCRCSVGFVTEEG